MGKLPFEELSFNEACWALDRTILNCGFLENQDYISKQVGTTQEYTFYQDGWAYCRIVLSPVIEGGWWKWKHSLISPSHPDNALRLIVWKSDVVNIPYADYGFIRELPNFTDRCNEVWNMLYQEWEKVAAAKTKSVTKTDSDSNLPTMPIHFAIRARAGAGADGDGRNWGVLMSGVPGTAYPMGKKLHENRERGMTLKTLEETWPNLSNESLTERLEIWKLWDTQRLKQRQILLQVNCSESTIKRHLTALEEAGLLKRHRRKRT